MADEKISLCMPLLKVCPRDHSFDLHAFLLSLFGGVMDNALAFPVKRVGWVLFRDVPSGILF